MNYKRLSIFVINILVLLISSGCWDYRDVTERGMIYAMAIDKKVVEKEHHEKEGYFIIEEEEEGKEVGEGKKAKEQYVVTLQLIEPTAIAGAEKKGVAKAAKWNIVSTKGDSIAGAIEEIDQRIYREPFLSHIRVILIGEELARDGITKSIDFFVRHPHIRKGTPVYVTKGPAEDVLKLEHPILIYSGLHLSLIPDITKRIRQTPEMDIGKLSKYIHEQADFIAPRAVLSTAKNEIKYAGAALFKKDKMTGWLGEREVLDWSLFCEACNKTPVASLCPHKGDNGIFRVEVRNKKDYYDVTFKNGQIHFTANIFVNADLKELQCKKCKMLDAKETMLMEEKLSKNIKERVMYTFNSVRDKFGIDIFMVKNQIRKFHPDIWKQVEKDWDKHFKDLKLEVNVVSSLRTAGVECRPDLPGEKK